MRMTLTEISSCLELDFRGVDTFAHGVCIDSRNCKPGDLFVCIPGERVDGHDFASKAVERGAVAILSQKPLSIQETPVFQVADTVKALGRLAACWRKRATSKVIAVTGSAGKTTLKDTLASIFSIVGNVAFTQKNHNNQIGLPCAVLSATGDEDWWIMELGISHAGDMEELGEILMPDFAIILNAADGHTEGLGDKGVAWHKSRLLKFIRPGGEALVSADYPELVEHCAHFRLPINYFSIHGKDVPWNLRGKGGRTGDYTFALDGRLEEYSTPFMGEFGAETALAAIATAKLMGLGRNEIQTGIEKATMPKQRLNNSTAGNWQIFDDTYNANPLSMRRMIEAVAGSAREDNLVLVLGEMGELGSSSSRCHFELGQLCSAVNPQAIFWHGKVEDILAGLRETGYDINKFYKIEDPEDFAYKARLARLLDKSGTILFKGSRFNRMERFLEKFISMNNGKDNVL